MYIIEYICHMCVYYNICVFFTVIYLYHIICSIRTHFGVSVRKTLSGPQSPTLCSFMLFSHHRMQLKVWGFQILGLDIWNPAVLLFHAWHSLAPLWQFFRAVGLKPPQAVGSFVAVSGSAEIYLLGSWTKQGKNLVATFGHQLWIVSYFEECIHLDIRF